MDKLEIFKRAVILVYDRIEDKEELEAVLKINRYLSLIDRIHEEVWRPSWKHGYNNKELMALLDDPEKGEMCYRVIELLHEIYVNILNEEK